MCKLPCMKLYFENVFTNANTSLIIKVTCFGFFIKNVLRLTRSLVI